MDKKTILLVEDNADDELLTIRALKKSNFANEVVVARDGAEAIEILFSPGAEDGNNPRYLPELILLDLKLPKISGIEVLARIRQHERTKLLPVVVLTSSDEEKDIVASYGLGANSYVRKPVDFQKFIEAIQNLGLYWLVLNTSPRPAR